MRPFIVNRRKIALQSKKGRNNLFSCRIISHVFAYAIKIKAANDGEEGFCEIYKIGISIWFCFVTFCVSERCARGKGTHRIEITENFMVKMSFTQLFDSLVTILLLVCACVDACVLVCVRLALSMVLWYFFFSSIPFCLFLAR